jgi:hypothetical protein
VIIVQIRQGRQLNFHHLSGGYWQIGGWHLVFHVDYGIGVQNTRKLLLVLDQSREDVRLKLTGVAQGDRKHSQMLVGQLGRPTVALLE